MVDVAMSAEIGAEAIEMLEWLTEFVPVGRSMQALRVLRLEGEWDYEGTFRSYCEALFRENKKGLSV
jgi:hypothetical protein